MTDQLASLYPQHLATVVANATAALARSGFDHLLLPSGVDTYRFLDDLVYPFRPNPQFLAWVPLTAHPHSWVSFTPGNRPVLVYYQPDDYWHLPPSAPSGFWPAHFELRVISSPAQAREHLPRDLSRAAIIGEPNAALADAVPNNPQRLIDALHLSRTRKSAYEVQCMRIANLHATRAHRAAATAYRERHSEHEINRAYCEAVGQKEGDLPYGNIVCLNAHSAVLHYQYQDRQAPAEHHSMLIDAGAQVNGYAADITRSYGDGSEQFSALLEGVTTAQLALTAQARPGTDYRQLHLDAHLKLAGLLSAQDIVRMSPESMVESGVSASFFPHGLGHYLGLQVHDVAGFLRDDSGATIDKPEGHPYLRLTRTLEVGNVLTIEPGVYFIDSLLAKLRGGPHAKCVNWGLVDALRPYGGIRIEDNVHITAGEPENLTRDAFRALAGE